MIKHGLSHAASSLACVVGGGFFTQYLLDAIPPANQVVKYLVLSLAKQEVHLSSGSVALLLTIILISFFWGALFKSITNNS